MAFDKPSIKRQLQKAKTALSEKDYSTYWDTVFGIAASVGGSDDGPEAEDDMIDKINRKLGGPGT
jgi:hypothetical protein